MIEEWEVTVMLRKLAMLGAVLSVAFGVVPAAAQTKITIAFPPSGDFTPLFAAKDQGFLLKRGIDATLTIIPLASNIPSAMVAGNVQIGMGTASMLLQTADAGLGLVAIGGAARFVKSNPIVSLVARSGTTVAGAADLRGKKIGVPGFNSMLHVLFQKWLLDHKVPLREVTMIETVFPRMSDMLKGGQLDAAVIIEPFRSRAISGGAGFRAADFVNEGRDEVVAAFWMARADWAKANLNVVKGFREAYDEAIAWALKNQAEGRALEKKYLGFPSPVVPTYSNKVTAEDLELFDRIGRELGMFKKPLDLKSLVLR